MSDPVGSVWVAGARPGFAARAFPGVTDSFDDCVVVEVATADGVLSVDLALCEALEFANAMVSLVALLERRAGVPVRSEAIPEPDLEPGSRLPASAEIPRRDDGRRGTA